MPCAVHVKEEKTNAVKIIIKQIFAWKIYFLVGLEIENLSQVVISYEFF